MPSAHDLSMLDTDELAGRLGESRRELFNLRFQLATGQLDNPSRIGQVRREVARMLTVLRGREILEAEGTYIAPTQAEHEAARAKLAAEDAEREEKVAAKAAAAEAEAGADGDHDHDHGVDALTDDDVDGEFDDEFDDELDDDDLDDDEEEEEA
jgi:large subunit ribosomal protein L29